MNSSENPVQKHPRSIVIIGAGVSGICLAIQLTRAGFDDVTILEKSADVGGTWLENSYPGCGCDVPSMLYSYSFAIKTDWSRKYALQPELHEYFKSCVERFGIGSRIRFGVTVTAARFDQARTQWQVELADGTSLMADILVSSVGQLNRPRIPNLPGRDDFQGMQCHTARWNHDFDFAGKRVAVIGSGASAIQVIPELASIVERLYVVQRSPNFVAPRNDKTYSEAATKRFKNIPGYARLYRNYLFAKMESRIVFYRRRSLLNKQFRSWLMKQMRDRLPEPLWKRVIPDYPAGCKRVLISDNYLQSLARENVTLINRPAQSLTADAIIAGDQTIPTDAVIYATGFQSTNFLAPMSIVGPAGTDLKTIWAQRPRTYLGMMTPGVPNFFMLYGPNTNIGHNSLIFMIECQVRFIIKSIKQMQQRDAQSVEVDDAAVERFDHSLQRNLSKLVWNEDCHNWYKNQTGSITNNWSGATVSYWWKTRGLHTKALKYR